MIKYIITEQDGYVTKGTTSVHNIGYITQNINVKKQRIELEFIDGKPNL